MHNFLEPTDDTLRDRLLVEAERFFGRIIADLITTFVDAVADPQAALDKAKAKVLEHAPAVMRLGRNLLVDLTANGVPDAIAPKLELVKAKVQEVPQLVGL